MRAPGPAAAALVALAVSAALLAYEILLVRAFAIRTFHHFATMAIGIAMLGFAASGTWLALRPPRNPRASVRLLAGAALLTPALLVLGPALAARVPLDPTQLPSDPREWPRLALVVLLLALPFFAGALAVLLAVAGAGPRTGFVYGASFLGSALGVALALAASFLPPPWTDAITPYKGLPQVEAYPRARRVFERSSPLGWVVAVEASAFRHAPGLSLTYEGPIPSQTAVFVDGNLVDAVSGWPDVRRAEPLVASLPASIPYALGGASRALVLGAGGGTDVWAALVGGAREVTAVELHPDLVRLARGALDAPASRAGARITWVRADARSFVARTSAPFDRITLGAGGALGTSIAGVHALSEDFLHTVEAYESYLRALRANGVLAVTRWATAPPRAEARAVLTAGEALRRVRPGGVERGLVVARSWATATVLVKPSGFSDRELRSLAAWTRSRQIDLDWYPGIPGPPAAPFHQVEDPALHRAARAAVSGPAEARRFAESYPFDIAPATDARPYPHHFLRGASLARLARAGAGSWLPFAEWGTVTILATLALSIGLGACLLALPSLLGRSARAGMDGAASAARGTGSQLVVFFLAIGLAYLAAEIAAIQTLGLLLGHPVYAVAGVLAAMLACSGIGSAWSDRVHAGSAAVGLAALALTFLGFGVALLEVARWAQGTPLAARALLASVLLAPPAFLMGWAFPLGMRTLAGASASRRGWAWAVNGTASVIAAPLSGILALERGSGAVFALAVGGYLAASIVLVAARFVPARQATDPGDAPAAFD